MRQAIYDYIRALPAATLGTYSLSSELPYSASGTPLYLKNFKKIYVGVDQINQDSQIDTLDGSGAVDEITTVRVYFVTDAKLLPSNYDQLVQAIKEARTTAAISGVRQRLCQVSADFQDDALITEFEFSFRTLITNQ